MFRHLGGMVGDPKTLYDLRKIEASLRVTCRVCKTVKVHNLEAVISSRSFHRQTMDWPTARREFVCQRCDVGEGHDVKVDAVPFGRDDRELREQRGRTLVMNLALLVLKDAAQRAVQEDVCTPAVRLALRVLRPCLASSDLLTTFWTAAQESVGKPWGGAQQAHRWIVAELVKRGHAVWAEFR
jgi:hypothetical protein